MRPLPPHVTLRHGHDNNPLSLFTGYGGLGLGVVDAGRLNRQHTGPSIRALGRALGDLANAGYDAVWHQVEAADTGAPHHRARIFLIAWPHDPQDRHPIPGLNERPIRQPDGHPFAHWQKDQDVWVSDMGADPFTDFRVRPHGTQESTLPLHPSSISMPSYSFG